MNDMPRMEPHADLRQMATVTRQTFIAYKDAGFNDEQALRLVIAMISRPTPGGPQ